MVELEKYCRFSGARQGMWVGSREVCTVQRSLLPNAAGGEGLN